MLKIIASIILFIPTLCFAISLDVEIKGVPQPLADIIRGDLHLQQATTEPKLTVARIQNLFDLSDEQITATLQAKGYYHSKLNKTLITIVGATPDKDKWIASFTINLGKPTRIAKVIINVEGSGKDDPRLQRYLKAPKLVQGKVLIHEDYENTKEKMISDFNSIGYLQADFSENVLEVDRSSYSTNVRITINTGMLYVFGKVSFIDCIYSDYLLNRYIPFHAGEPYNLKKLMEFQSNLESADLFSKIRFDPITNFENENDIVVPIKVRLTAKPRNRYSGSVGYGTDTGVRGSLGWLHRRTKTPGHKILTQLNLSKVLNTAKLNYIIPGEQAATDRYVIGTTGQEEHIKNLRTRKGEVYVNKIIKRGMLESSYGINYFIESFHITATDVKQTKKYLLPNAKWSLLNTVEKPEDDEGDDFDYGTRVDLSVRGGFRKVLSATDVIQVEAHAKQIWPLFDQTRLLLRANVGSVTSRNFNALPPSLRFFTGGDDSVRGFAYESIGPRAIKGNPNSDNIGGRYLLVMSAEVERKVYDQITGVLFFDAGNASMNFGGPLAMGPGFGVRYRTPIGNFRVDLAKPLNTVINKHWRIHVTFGTDF
jgi:translocation and assembly module TamA